MNKVKILQVSPNGVGPSWWRQTSTLIEALGCNAVDYGWHTVTEDGGFTSGVDWSQGLETDEELEERVEAWFDAHDDDGWPWRFRVLCGDPSLRS
jgi:hypothetical protein